MFHVYIKHDEKIITNRWSFTESVHVWQAQKDLPSVALNSTRQNQKMKLDKVFLTYSIINFFLFSYDAYHSVI